MNDASKPQPERFYMDELHVGQRFTSGSAQIERDRVISFATEFDPQPFHLDEELAKGTLFKGLAASGWHTASVTMRLLVDGGLPFAGGLVGGAVSIEWPTPTRPGDILHVDSEIVDITRSRSRPNRGVVTVAGETKNQRDEIVQKITVRVHTMDRPAS